MHWYSSLIPFISKTGYKIRRFFHCIGISVCGQDILNLRSVCSDGLPGCSEDMQKRHYLQYNASVKELVPANQLLVFNVKHGWEPLCKFLDLPIPDFPFPHENKITDDGRVAVIDQSQHFDVIKKAKSEIWFSLTLSLGCLALIVGVTFCKFVNEF